MSERPAQRNDGDLWHAAAARTALVAGVFCVVVLAMLLANHLRARTWNPLQPRRIEALQVELAKHPNDDNIKAEIRRIDQQMRQEYFRSRHFATQGAYLLLGGVIIYLLAWEVARRRRELLPVPDSTAGHGVSAAAARGRRGVTAMGLLLAGALLVVASLSRHDAMTGYAKALALLQPGTAAPGEPGPAPSSPGPAAPGTAAAPPGQVVAPPPPTGMPGMGGLAPSPLTPATITALPPYPEAWTRNWPVFRGPQGNGTAISGAPDAWNGKTGAGIRWKTALPLPGHNSPIVWGDAVFLSGATDKEQQVFCYDADTGALRWKATVSTPESAGAEAPKVMEDTGYAAPTMATDGEGVFAIFPTGDVAAFDLAGKALWTRNLGTPESSYGHAASLALAPTRLFIQLDQGSSADDGLSALLALNPRTGETVWTVKRPVPNSWSSPVVARVGDGFQLVTAANPWVIAYDPGSGGELWRANCLSGDVGPTPIVANGLVLATTAYANLAAIRPDGRGDVTKTHIAWMAADGLPDTVSPLAAGETVLLADSSGLLTCYDVKSGAKLWEHSYTTYFRASPVLIGPRVYLTDTDGVTHILEAGRTFKEVAAMPLGEEVSASPAIVNGRIYLRGKSHLFCIGGGDAR